MRGLLVAFALLFTAAASASAQTPAPAVDGFVRAHRSVSTASALAQAAFDDGLTLLYAYNPDQARRSFERAVAADPALAIAWWGIAMSHGPNINTEYDAGQAKQGHSAIEKAASFAKDASPVERALIDAAAKRFASPGDKRGEASAQSYRAAMVAVSGRFPDDDDVQTLTAEAGMDLRPWTLYNEDGLPERGTQDIVSRLQLVLARNPAHIGAEHFLIHAVEASQHPELALEGARRLAADALEPGAEHLIHMPAHTFERIGAYHEAGEANARAVDAFAAYLGNDPADGHAGYLGHDCLFGVDAFMMSGEYARALRLAQTCALHGSGAGLSRVVNYRFRRWAAIEQGGTGEFVAAMVAVHDRDFVGALKKSSELATQKDSTTALVASAVVAAAVAREKGETASELASLTRAVSLEDRSGYQEPPAFWFPVRESLGAAQLRASSAREAAVTFRADLVKNPNNPRSLFGLAAALERLGDTDGASAARKRYETAWGHADAQLALDEL